MLPAWNTTCLLPEDKHPSSNRTATRTPGSLEFGWRPAQSSCGRCCPTPASFCRSLPNKNHDIQLLIHRGDSVWMEFPVPRHERPMRTPIRARTVQRFTYGTAAPTQLPARTTRTRKTPRGQEILPWYLAVLPVPAPPHSPSPPLKVVNASSYGFPKCSQTEFGWGSLLIAANKMILPFPIGHDSGPLLVVVNI